MRGCPWLVGLWSCSGAAPLPWDLPSAVGPPCAAHRLELGGPGCKIGVQLCPPGAASIQPGAGSSCATGTPATALEPAWRWSTCVLGGNLKSMLIL